MKVPLSWLKDYVNLDLTAEDLARRLTFSGTEVEGLETIGADLSGVVVGEVLSVEPHPKADRLRLCRVTDGKCTLRVVCGAPNVAVGMKAPLAVSGTVLPNGMTIKTAELRGQVSEGMLCAEDELGLSADHSGVMVLDPGVAAGTPLSRIVGDPEVVLQVEVTWNRPDCLSMMGMAREIAALTGGRLQAPSVDFAELGEPVEALADVSIEDADGCPRYTARVLTDVRLLPSPAWMQKRLTLCGVRPINNIVDITNYVMIECGQPLHAFDYELLREHRIVVRRVRAGEALSTLDDVQRPITPQMLVIADAARPVALAGIMGGAGSEIRDTTRTVLLESAFFSPASIHRTSNRLGLSTESSHRFERTVDIGAVEWAGRRAAKLMVELGGAVAARGVIDAYPGKTAEKRLRCRYGRTRSLLGIDLKDEEIVQRLESVALPVVARDADGCTVGVPTFRPDIEIEADLIEEVARLHGLDAVPDTLPQARINPEVNDIPFRALGALRGNLAGLGLSETMNYSFVSEALLNRLSPGEVQRRVVLPNPVSSDYAVLRDSLVPQMVESLGRNQSRQTALAAFFEMGRVFSRNPESGIGEEERLCIGLMGKVGRHGLDGRQPVTAEEMFLSLKGLVEALFAAQRLGEPELGPAESTYFEPGWSVSVAVNGRCCGRLGLLRDDLRREWRIPEPVGLAEFDTASLVGRFAEPRSVSPIPGYPSIVRDIALIVDETVRHEDVVRLMRKAGPPELTEIELFDIFRSQGIGDAKKSMAYSVVYRSLERTLTDEDANRYHETVSLALKKELNAQVREG